MMVRCGVFRSDNADEEPSLFAADSSGSISFDAIFICPVWE